MPRTLAPRRLAAAAVSALAIAPLAGCGSGGAGAGGSDPASLAPLTSVMYAEVTVQPEEGQRESFRAVAKKITGSSDVSGELERAVAKITDGDVDFRRDVEPWLGDRVGAALTAMPEGEQAAEDEGDGALIAQTTDPDEALEAMGRLAAKKGPVRDASYKDTEYRTADGAAYGIVEDSLVLGTEAGFKAVVDAAGGESLADADDFQATRDAVEDERLAFLYLDVRRIADVMAASGEADGVDPAALRELLGGEGTRTYGAALHVRDDAILVDTAALGGKAPSGDPAGTVAALPAGSWLALGLGDIGKSLQDLVATARRLGDAGGDRGTVDQGLQQLERRLGLDLEDDLLSWMGDAGLFARGTSLMDIGGALVVRTKDPAKTRAALDRVRELAGGLGTVRDLRGSGIDAGLEVSPEGAPVQLLAALAGDRFVLALSRSALDAAIRPDKKLADDPAFEAADELLGDGWSRRSSSTCGPSCRSRASPSAATRASSRPSATSTRSPSSPRAAPATATCSEAGSPSASGSPGVGHARTSRP
jgi:hypothetical protein